MQTFKDVGSAPVKTRDAKKQRRFRQLNPGAAKAIKARYMKNRGGLMGRIRHLRERYGITLERFEEMLKEQGNACAVCEKPFGEAKAKQPCVDHHHASGRIRGLLHRDCNSALGVFRDSAAVLRRAAEYVDQEDTCL